MSPLVYQGPPCLWCALEGVFPARPACEDGLCSAHGLLERAFGGLGVVPGPSARDLERMVYGADGRAAG